MSRTSSCVKEFDESKSSSSNERFHDNGFEITSQSKGQDLQSIEITNQTCSEEKLNGKSEVQL